MSCVIPLQHIHVGAEILLDVDLLPTDAKRLATSIYRAARRVRELLRDLASVVSGNRPTIEIWDLHEVIAAASAAASAATGNTALNRARGTQENRVADTAISYAARVL
jgi:hypothetical protein